MIDYTDHLARLMRDIVARVPTLSFIEMDRVLVFARSGRTQAEGAYATCHCICLPPTEPGYYFWRDRETGHLTRRSQWFVTKSPRVCIGPRRIDYMVSFTLPRFCDQRLEHSRKRIHYRGLPTWVAKLDTIVHELYHIDPRQPGIRRMERGDGTYSANCHGDRFFSDVVAMVHHYLDTKPDPGIVDFLRYDFDGLTTRFGAVVGTAFRRYPSYPQRYAEVLDPQPAPLSELNCPVEPMRQRRVMTSYGEHDLVRRRFLQTTSRRMSEPGRLPGGSLGHQSGGARIDGSGRSNGRDAPGAHEPSCPIGSGVGFYADDAAGTGGMDESSASQRDADM